MGIEDDAIIIQNLGTNDWCITLILPTEKEAIEFEKKVYSAILHIALKSNDLTLLFDFKDKGQTEIITA